MSRDMEAEAAARDAEPLWRSVAVLLVVGVALGLGYNALGKAGNPPRGLSWIAEAKALPSLEEAKARAAGAPRPRTPVSDDPLALAGGASAAGEGLPEIPDVDRPIKIQLAAVKTFLDAGAALFVDAREAAEFAAAHIPGAVNLPFDQSVTDPARLEKLDSRGRPIIVYCGGDGCEVSIQLAEALVLAGHRKVLVYEGGFPEWTAAGYPTLSGPEPGERTR